MHIQHGDVLQNISHFAGPGSAIFIHWLLLLVGELADISQGAGLLPQDSLLQNSYQPSIMVFAGHKSVKALVRDQPPNMICQFMGPSCPAGLFSDARALQMFVAWWM